MYGYGYRAGTGMLRSAAFRLRSSAAVGVVTRTRRRRVLLSSSPPCHGIRSWESAGFCTASAISFPWLAVIPSSTKNKDDKKLTFLSHGVSDRIYKVPLPSSSSSCGKINCKESFMRSNKDGWMMFVCRDSFVPVIVNPLTGAQLPRLPSLYNFLNHRYPQWKRLDYDIFLTDNCVAFVKCCVDRDYHILAAATPGDDEWCFVPLSSEHLMTNPIRSIVFHEDDNKFYYMDCGDQMQSFRLTRRCCDHRKKKTTTTTTTSVFENVSSILADTTTSRAKQAMLFDSHLVSDGSNLLRVRKRLDSNEFDISEYSSCEDQWMEVTNTDLGNKSLFFDRYGAKLLTLGGDGYLQREDKGRPRRNCIYFTDQEFYFQGGKIVNNTQYVRFVGVYDVDKGTVEPCFPTSNAPSDYHLLPTLMWFIPSLSDGSTTS